MNFYFNFFIILLYLASPKLKVPAQLAVVVPSIEL